MTASISDRDDEIVSAVLDGEATPEEVALVEADPALARRRDELALVRELVAGPVESLDEVTRRRLVSAALAHAQRELPWWRRGNLIGVGSAAAVVVVLAVLVGPTILGGMSGDDGDASNEVASLADDPTTTFAFDGADGGATGYSEETSDDDAETTTGRVSGDTGGAESPDERGLPIYVDVAAFDLAVRQRHQQRSDLDGQSPAMDEETDHFANRYGDLIEELFIRCGFDFIEEHATGGAELVDQVEAMVDGRRLVAVATVELPPSPSTELTVKIIDPERCEAVSD